ncbi:MAG: hypothetical protein ACFFCS_22475 [Candidatus Hodarchaeota archaeon]
MTQVTIYQKRLDEELEEEIGLEDYEVDRIKIRSKIYFQGRTVDADIQFAKKTMNLFLIGLSAFAFVFLVLFCAGLLGIFPFVYFYLAVQVLLIYWRFVVSPLRYHGFESDEQFIIYRGYLTQGPRMKSQLRDDKYKFLVFFYILWNLMVLCAIPDAQRMLPYLNNVIYDRGMNPSSMVDSLVPALVPLGLIVNVFGAIMYGKYRKINLNTRDEAEDRRMRLLLLGIVFASLIFLFIMSVMQAPEFAVFWKPSPGGTNLFSYFDPGQPLSPARLHIYLYYTLTFAGVTVLGLFVLMGLTAMETALIHRGTNNSWNRGEPVEKNWEYKGTLERQEKKERDKIKTRKRSIIEMGLFNLGAVTAMWLFMWWGGEILGSEIMEYTSYGILGIMALWWLVFSWIFHAKKDGKFHYPTRKHNAAYAFFDERGMGSWKHYYREVFGKKKSLVLWTLFFILLITSLFNFDELDLMFMNWEDIFKKIRLNETVPVPQGVMVDFADIFGVDPYATAVAIVVVVTGLSVVAFIAALGKTEKNFGGSKFWCNFFKGVVGCIVLLCFFWASRIPQIIDQVNILSMDFLVAVLVMVLFFGLIAMAWVFVLMPIVVKFDNLRKIRYSILQIIIMTVVLLVVISVIFDWLLPMSDINGDPIIHGYPFTGYDGGADPRNYEVNLLWSNFDLAEFLAEWAGRYIIWGSVQQYLFMGYFLELWKKIFPRSKGYIVAVGTSCIFGVIHAIDWPVMLFTFVAGLFWAYDWNKEKYDKQTGKVYRGNNLLLWGIVHGFGATLAGMLMPFGFAVGPFNV